MFSFFKENNNKKLIPLSRQGEEAKKERKQQRVLQNNNHSNVHYFSSEKQEKHTAHLLDGKFYKLTQHHQKILNGKFLYVMLADEKMIIAKPLSKNNKKYFHSSLANGKKVLAAGMIVIENGLPIKISNESGHYKPTDQEMRFILNKLLLETDNPQLIYESHCLAAQKITHRYLASDFLRNENPHFEIGDIKLKQIDIDEDTYQTEGQIRSRYAGNIKKNENLPVKPSRLIEKEPVKKEISCCKKYCAIL